MGVRPDVGVPVLVLDFGELDPRSRSIDSENKTQEYEEDINAFLDDGSDDEDVEKHDGVRKISLKCRALAYVQNHDECRDMRRPCRPIAWYLLTARSTNRRTWNGCAIVREKYLLGCVRLREYDFEKTQVPVFECGCGRARER